VANVSSGGSKPDQVFVLPGDAYAYSLNAGAPDRIGVIALDGANSSLETTIPIGNTGISWTNYGIRSDLQFDPSGQYAILANPFDDALQFIDLNSHEVVSTIPVPGFPLQIAGAPDAEFDAFFGVTTKNNASMALLGGVGTGSSYVESYPFGGNPTRIAYNPVAREFAATSQDDRSLETFSLEELAFVEAKHYTDHTHIAVKFAENGRRFVVLLSDDETVTPNQLEVDDVTYDLPGSPMHHFDINAEGTLAAVALPVTDEVVLLKEGPLGFEESVISLKNNPYIVAPNPADDFISFKLKEGEKPRQPLEIKLFRMDGSLVFEKKVAGLGDLHISRLPEWQPGLYGYELISNGQRVQDGKIVLK